MDKPVGAQELKKVADFIASINNLIHGKFILADVKINEVLNKIDQSEALFRFIQEQLIGFHFEKELRKAEVKNRFNGGVFKLPNGEKESVALAFCLLVEFDTKHLDFYEFIKENFPTLDNKGDYQVFAETVLAPLRDSIAKQFGLSKDDNEGVLKELEQKAQEEQEQKEQELEEEQEEKNKEDELFLEIEKIERHLLDIVKNDPKIKEHKKEDLIYLLKAMIYANKYRDFKLISAFLVSFEHLTKKVRSKWFVYEELKNVILRYYESQKN
jgi:hypothetical protein